MNIRRAVPDITSARIAESREFYVGLLGFEVAMDLGSVVTFASPTNPTAQVTVIREDGSSPISPQMTVEVADVDAVHAEAIRRGAEVVYPLTDEPWGVRRFFLRDPNGIVVNVMCHHARSAGSAPSDPPQPLALFRMATGYYVSRALHAAAELGIADVLAQGPRHYEDLAKATGTHAASLNRVLRLLASVGVFTEEDGGRFALTPLGQYLKTGVPGSMRAAVRLFGGRTQDAWTGLLDTVRTGDPAFRQSGQTDPFARMAGDPEAAALFDEAMADWTKQVAVAAAAAYDFSRFGTIVDVGGGNGTLLAGILGTTAGPRGIVFDQPHVAERAQARLAELGLSARCSAVGGDFFKEVPRGGDAYVLKHVIHDWNDERAIEILKVCRRAMSADAKLLIIEGVYPPRIDQSPASHGAAANDVNMLVCTGGRQRSEPEFRALYEASGFRLTRLVPTPPLQTRVIEGVPS